VEDEFLLLDLLLLVVFAVPEELLLVDVFLLIVPFLLVVPFVLVDVFLLTFPLVGVPLFSVDIAVRYVCSLFELKETGLDLFDLLEATPLLL
jgi:hypothetical protein